MNCEQLFGATIMTNTQIETLSAINVGVVNDEGCLEATITLAEFLRVAKSQHIYVHTNASRGEIDFDLTVSNTDNIIGKVEEWRKRQQKKVEVTGVVFCSSDSNGQVAAPRILSCGLSNVEVTARRSFLKINAGDVKAKLMPEGAAGSVYTT